MRRLPRMITFLALGLAGCAGTGSASGGAEEPSSLAYGRDAQELYENALLAFRRDRCIDAEPAFGKIRREYPYSRFAALAELRIADCKYKAESFAEAISAYRNFVRFRPSHAQIPYARFRIADSHFRQIPSEWLLSPPVYERDQRDTQEALRQLRRFLLDFPNDERGAEVREMIDGCLRILAEHELYVARFYLARDHYPATVLRLRTLLTAYEGSGVEPDALLLLGRTYLRMDESGEAQAAFQELVDRFPESDQAGDARRELRRLEG
ncbi:MAG: outer membrane protein assembly factor BamD [Myxococcota bacterium]